jgi:nucleotide-binding universal stress UspA family protein
MIGTSTKLIISANDGSAGAERAVAFAADLAKSLDTRLLIVHVSEDKLTSKERMLLNQFRLSEGDALEEISQRILSRAKAIAHDHGAPQVETMIAAGDPAHVLIQVATNEHADAIVVGRRGCGQLEGLLLGSVSQKLSCLAPCAVVVVP